MIAKDKELAKQRTQTLIDLRTQHRDQVKQVQEFLKEQQIVRKKLRLVMQGAPRSVLQVSKLTGTPAYEVLWHIAAMKKYGLVEEMGMDESGDYYLYGLSKEGK